MLMFMINFHTKPKRTVWLLWRKNAQTVASLFYNGFKKCIRALLYLKERPSHERFPSRIHQKHQAERNKLTRIQYSTTPSPSSPVVSRRQLDTNSSSSSVCPLLKIQTSHASSALPSWPSSGRDGYREQVVQWAYSSTPSARRECSNSCSDQIKVSVVVSRDTCPWFSVVEKTTGTVQLW